MTALRDVAGHAVLAPSSHNSQPWRFGLEDGALTLRADPGRALPVVDPDGRELIISCGAALLNARVAATHLIGEAACEPFPEPRQPVLLARLSVNGRQGSAEDAVLFEAIRRRRTYRRRFAERPVAPALVTELEQCALAEGAWLRVLDPAQRATVAALVAEGDRLQWADPAWRGELAAWMRPRRQGDGLTVPVALAAPVRAIVAELDLGRAMARRDRALAEQAPLLAVVETDADTTRDWLAAGQALELVLLRAAAAGLQASFLNQPVQLPELRDRLRRELGGQRHPQLVVRMGYPRADVPAPPRRPVELGGDDV